MVLVCRDNCVSIFARRPNEETGEAVEEKPDPLWRARRHVEEVGRSQMIRTGQRMYLDRQKHLVEATTDQNTDADGSFFCFKVLSSQKLSDVNKEGIAILDKTDTWKVAWIA